MNWQLGSRSQPDHWDQGIDQKNLGRQKTVLFSTHILPEVEAVPDRILIINKGKIVADGTANTLRQQAQGQEHIMYGLKTGRCRISMIPSALCQCRECKCVLDAGKSRFEVISKPNLPSNRQLLIFVYRNIGWSPKWFHLKLNSKIFRDLTMNWTPLIIKPFFN